MKHGRYQTIEGNKEVQLHSIIIDVRSQSEKFFAWLAQPNNFSKFMIGVAIAFFVLPILLPILVISVIILADQYSRVEQFLPMRYPAWAKLRDPSLLHPSTDVPQPAQGIMFFGVVDAKDPYERGKQVFLTADDLTRHMLVLGTTGSGKSEFLKGMTFNVLCWASGFFVADAKADNKLPTDLYSQVRMFARDYDFLVINYLLGGLSPTQIANMRERLSNGLQPATAADADTLVQMTSNMMVKASGDSKTWQERGLNLFRGVCRALVHKRDLGQITLSMEVLREYLGLEKIEELYIEGWKLANEGQSAWATPYIGVKTYLEIGLPGFKVDVMLRKHGLLREDADDDAASMAAAFRGGGAPKKPQPTTQSNDTYNQHGYRSDQVYPALSLLIDTYGHIFKRKHPEVDMQDVVVNNRICVSLIPSLEKGSQEQESLGKLNLALLRVMMARALGMSVEGDVKQIVDAKITASATPFALFLDEFAYQFAEGIALTAAQARSLNFFLCALAQDLEKLTEGERAAEAGAMMANQATKYFMKIVGSDKTHELAQKTLGEADVVLAGGYERQTDIWGTVRRNRDYRVEKRPRIPREVLEELASGFATFCYRRRAHVMRTFYPSGEVPRVRYPRINRFLQIPDISNVTMMACSIDMHPTEDKWAIDQVRKVLNAKQPPEYGNLVTSDVIQALVAAARDMNPQTPAIERGIVLYQAGVEALAHARKGQAIISRNGGGAQRNAPAQNPAPQAPRSESVAPASAAAAAVAAGDAAFDVPEDTRSAEDILADFDPLSEITKVTPPLERKPKEEVFADEMAQVAERRAAAGIVDSPEENAPPLVGVPEPDDAGGGDPDDGDLIFGDDDGVVPPVDGVATTPEDASDEITTHEPVKDPEQVKADLEALARTPIQQEVVERMGEEVVGLREPSLEGLKDLEVALGATEDQAVSAAANTEKAVAQGLSVLDNNKLSTSSSEMEMLFSELENVISTGK